MAGRKNSLGLIFKVDKQVGRGDVIDIISDFSDGSVLKKQYHHEFCDGLGALLLSAQEWSGSSLVLPSRRIRLTPSLSQCVAGFQGFFEDLAPHVTKWKVFDSSQPYSPNHIARRVFSHASSELILQTAKAKGVSVNALMLWHLNSVISKNLMCPEQSSCHWVVPVNMRRARGEELRIENRISSVGLHFSKDWDVKKLADLYSAKLNPIHAFANEFLTELLALLGEEKLLKLAQTRGNSNSWTGIFTNLGQWDFPDLPQLHRWPEAVSITPPGGTPVLPIGAGIMTWRGHLSVSIRLHPALSAHDPQLPDALLDGVKNSLEQAIGKSISLLRESTSRSNA